MGLGFQGLQGSRAKLDLEVEGLLRFWFRASTWPDRSSGSSGVAGLFLFSGCCQGS